MQIDEHVQFAVICRSEMLGCILQNQNRTIAQLNAMANIILEKAHCSGATPTYASFTELQKVTRGDSGHNNPDCGVGILRGFTNVVFEIHMPRGGRNSACNVCDD